MLRMSRLIEWVGHQARAAGTGCHGLGTRANPLVQPHARGPETGECLDGERLPPAACAILARSLLAQAAPALALLHAQGWPEAFRCLAAQGEDEAAAVWALGLRAASLLAQQSSPFEPSRSLTRRPPTEAELQALACGELTEDGLVARLEGLGEAENHAAISAELADKLTAFAAWRQALPTCLPIGNHHKRTYDLRHLEDSALQPDQGPFARFFACVRDADAKLCQFILKSMLQPRAATRATLQDVANFMDKQQAQCGDPRAQLARVLRQHLPAGAEQVEVVKLLQHLRLSESNTSVQVR